MTRVLYIQYIISLCFKTTFILDHLLLPEWAVLNWRDHCRYIHLLGDFRATNAFDCKRGVALLSCLRRKKDKSGKENQRRPVSNEGKSSKDRGRDMLTDGEAGEEGQEPLSEEERLLKQRWESGSYSVSFNLYNTTTAGMHLWCTSFAGFPLYVCCLDADWKMCSATNGAKIKARAP